MNPKPINPKSVYDLSLTRRDTMTDEYVAVYKTPEQAWESARFFLVNFPAYIRGIVREVYIECED